ncbi:tetratricopeptide repeat protein [Treponema sp. OMZ 840]|uniref:tetratricopeptide repeat protein n=1 Tax=Treponema sp. OMZ 840 TaxID=244313 RepID=UPI003D94D9EC
MTRFFAVCAALLLFVACSSAPQKKGSPPVQDSEGNSLPVIKTPVAGTYFSSYFKGVNTSVLVDIQNGSPLAIRRAVSALHKPDGRYSEQEQVLFAICSAIIKYAWPKERVTWTLPSVSVDNLYTATLDSIDKGIFAFPSADDDVFMLTLPCLAVFSSSAVNGFYAQAALSLEKVLKIYPDSVLNLYLAGTVAFRTKEYERAAYFFKKAVDIEPDNQYIVPMYINALLQSGKAAAAYELTHTFLQKEPQHAEYLKLYARSAFALKRYTEAENSAARVLQREPDNIEFLLFRARVLFELQEYLSVSTLLDLCAKSDKTSKEYLLLRSRLQAVWNKNISAAVATIQEAFIQYKDDTDVLIFAAELSAVSGQTVDGKTALELAAAVLEKEPGNPRALAVLAQDSVKRKDWQNAYDAVTALAQLETLSVEHTLLYVQICLALNKIEQARLLLKDLYTSETTDEHIRQWYIRLLIAEGKKNEAASLINGLLPNAAGKMKSVLYYERSRLGSSDAQVLADLRSSLTANPRNENALYDLYAYYYRQKDYRKAQYYLKQVIALNPNDAGFLKLNAELETLLK